MTRDAKIYVASRASLPERPAMWRAFRDEGIAITSTWIDESALDAYYSHERQPAAFLRQLWDRIASEIGAASALVLYAEAADFPLKGAFIEAGIALGMCKPVVICLPGVELDDARRPIGSWIEHPLVWREDDARRAMRLALSLHGIQKDRQ